ncbi:MAG: hypothetical protein GY842_17250 [bacterium]|nr:hypothetical protein [bacterium]
MKTASSLKVTAAALAAGLVIGSGGCLPNNYWANFLGDTFLNATGQVLEDFISDSVDAVDPALDVNQI